LLLAACRWATHLPFLSLLVFPFGVTHFQLLLLLLPSVTSCSLVPPCAPLCPALVISCALCVLCAACCVLCAVCPLLCALCFVQWHVLGCRCPAVVLVWIVRVGILAQLDHSLYLTLPPHDSGVCCTVHIYNAHWGVGGKLLMERIAMFV
jgi:hypothetical protein